MTAAPSHETGDGSPALIALDWGTSACRAFLLDGGGNVLETRAEPWGIMHVPGGDFAAAFDRLTGTWRERQPALHAIAAGMIGSAQGWVEAPYCAVPAGVDDLAAALTPVPGWPLCIVSGLATFGDRADVMRGEETQVVGALDLDPRLASRSVLVLPGTHSKWVEISDSRIMTFTTYMTGELFAVLRDHSILGRFARHAAGTAASEEMVDAFTRGVIAARASPSGMASTIFSARSLVLTGLLSPELSLEYLSGLLIGEELRCGLARGARPTALAGDAVLCARYVTALAVFEISDVPVVEGAAQTGLWRIAEHAGLTSVLSTDT